MYWQMVCLLLVFSVSWFSVMVFLMDSCLVLKWVWVGVEVRQNWVGLVVFCEVNMIFLLFMVMYRLFFGFSVQMVLFMVIVLVLLLMLIMFSFWCFRNGWFVVEVGLVWVGSVSGVFIGVVLLIMKCLQWVYLRVIVLVLNRLLSRYRLCSWLLLVLWMVLGWVV